MIAFKYFSIRVEFKYFSTRVQIYFCSCVNIISSLPADHLGEVCEPGDAGHRVEALEAPPPVLGGARHEPQLARLPQPREVSLAVVVTNLGRVKIISLTITFLSQSACT